MIWSIQSLLFVSFHDSLTSKSLVVSRPGFEGCRLSGRKCPPGPLLLLPAAVVSDCHEVVLEVGEVGTEVVAVGPQLLARGVDVTLGCRGHDDAGVLGPWVCG